MKCCWFSWVHFWYQCWSSALFPYGLYTLGGHGESTPQGAAGWLGERTLTPSLGNPPNPPRWMFSRGEPEQKYTRNVSLRITFHTHAILESLIITMPNYYFSMCHIELRSLGSKLINVDQSKCDIRLSVSPTAWSCTDPQQLQLLGDSAHFVFKCRDSGINGNWLTLMNRF